MRIGVFLGFFFWMEMARGFEARWDIKNKMGASLQISLVHFLLRI